MAKSKPRSRDRQRMRREVDAVVAPLPANYVLESIAKRLELTDGRFEVRFRDGFMQEMMLSRRLKIRRDSEAPPGSEEKGTGDSQRSPS